MYQYRVSSVSVPSVQCAGYVQMVLFKIRSVPKVTVHWNIRQTRAPLRSSSRSIALEAAAAAAQHTSDAVKKRVRWGAFPTSAVGRTATWYVVLYCAVTFGTHCTSGDISVTDTARTALIWNWHGTDTELTRHWYAWIGLNALNAHTASSKSLTGTALMFEPRPLRWETSD
jgi:hypothetical protein